ncbi:MAG: cytochrome c, partial [Planctomycetaceae bacterium]
MGRLVVVCSVWLALALVGLAGGPVGATEPTRESDHLAAAQRGWQWLTTKPYLPPDFTAEQFAALYTVWPEPLRQQAEQATAAERRKLAFDRYGLIERPDSPGVGPPLGYVDNGAGGWSMNCLACHQGAVEGVAIPGVPNSLFLLETLTDDVRKLKLARKEPLGRMKLGGLRMSLGETRGTTNAVMFGVVLGALRDRDLNFRLTLQRPRQVDHDMEPPPFWNTGRKTHLYCDGFVEKGPRPLLQFVMVPENSGETIRSWEGEYADILAWIESLTPPKYPGTIDDALAATGRQAFEAHCARCHGTYGPEGKYPEKMVLLEDVRTDPVRLESLSVAHRAEMQQSWYGDYGERDYKTDPGGYVAPPLHGVWASAPYLHNGSVPTLWHVLHPSERPAVWRRELHTYDHDRVGLRVEAGKRVPPNVSDEERREYFDT